MNRIRNLTEAEEGFLGMLGTPIKSGEHLDNLARQGTPRQESSGRFFFISAKLAKQVSDRFASETGWLVFDGVAGSIVYRLKRESEAKAASARLNKLNGSVR